MIIDEPEGFIVDASGSRGAIDSEQVAQRH